MNLDLTRISSVLTTIMTGDWGVLDGKINQALPDGFSNGNGNRLVYPLLPYPHLFAAPELGAPCVPSPLDPK